jgi:hypothetical protein
MVMNWQRPKKPNYTTGRIVIHSDDGRVWDYTQFFKIIQRAITKQNQFNPLKHGIFCPAINTGYVDSGWHETVGLPMMTWDMIEEIAQRGGEILSHGKYHLFLSGTPITQVANSGDTRLHYSNSQGRPRENFKFFITDGTNRDDFIVTTYNHLGTGMSNYMDINIPLTHSYNTTAKIYLHEDMMAEQLGGAIEDLAQHNIVCKHHINAWYYNSEGATPYLEQYFDSVITYQHDKTNINIPSNLYDLSRTIDLRHYSFAEIDLLLDDIQNKDSVGFIQNHGQDNPTTFANLDYLVSQALKRGIRLVTHSEAIEFLKSKGVS